MTHHPTPSLNNVLERKIEEILQEYTNIDSLKVFAAGNSILSSFSASDKQATLDERKYVIELLGKYFKKSQLRTKWAPGDCTVELTLDLSIGRFQVEIVTDEQMQKDLGISEYLDYSDCDDSFTL